MSLSSPVAEGDWAGGVQMGEGFQNFFTDIRIHQIREMQKVIAREEGIPYYDFGHIWEGFQEYQDKVHPQMVRSLPSDFLTLLRSKTFLRLMRLHWCRRSLADTSSTRPCSITFGWSQGGEGAGPPSLLTSSSLSLSAQRRRCSRAARKDRTVVVEYGESRLHW